MSKCKPGFKYQLTCELFLERVKSFSSLPQPFNSLKGGHPPIFCVSVAKTFHLYYICGWILPAAAGARASVRNFLQIFPNPLHNTFNILKDLMICKPYNFYIIFLHFSFPPNIVFFLLIMDFTIQFYHQFSTVTVKISNKPFNGMLSFKTNTELFITKPFPKQFFCLRHIVS